MCTWFLTNTSSAYWNGDFLILCLIIEYDIEMKVLYWTSFLGIYSLGVINLWRPQKMTIFVTPIHLLDLLKGTIDLLFKNYRIHKHVTNFKTSKCSLRVGTINLQSPIASESYLYETNFGSFFFLPIPHFKLFLLGCTLYL